MDIALLQMAQPRVQATNQSKTSAVQGTPSQSEKSFDKVFNEAVEGQQVQESTNKTTETSQLSTEVVQEEIVEVVETDSLKDLFDLLGINYDESMLFVELNGDLIAIDQLMNLEDITEMLGMTMEQLQQMIQQLTDGEVQVTDIWTLLEQAPQLLAQVMATLNGESNTVTPKEAGQLVNVLKLATLLGQKTDTVYSQEVKLVDAKNALQTLVSQLQQTSQSTQQPIQFTKVIEQVVQTQQGQTQAKQETNDSQAISVQQNQQNTAPTRAVTVTLPMERSQQSEALVKEIQQLLNKSQIVNNQGTIKLMLKLFPENLGQIRIEIMQQDGVMQARLLATTSAGKELLDSSLNQLKTSLVAQNIQMDRIDIAQSLQSSDASRDQGFFNQFFRQQQEEVVEEEVIEDDESISFEEFLNEQLNSEEV